MTTADPAALPRTIRADPHAGIGARLAADPAALDEAYATLGPMTLGFLRTLLPAHDAEDVLQQTFLELWRDRQRYDPTRPLASWVLGIARHRALDALRRRRPTDLVGEPPEPTPVAVDDLADRFARAQDVRDALALLSPEQRRVLTLAYFDDLSQTEIAEWLGVPLGTVKARAARGLRALRGHLHGDLPGEEAR